MKTLKFFLVVFLMLWIPKEIYSQEYPLQVTLTAKPKFTPILGDFLDNPAQYINVSIKGATEQKEVYLLFKMEQIAPVGDASIATKAFWRPTQPILIPPTGTTFITSAQMTQHFADTSTNDFNTVGLELDDYQDSAMISSRVPEGTYRLCVYACDFNEPMGYVKALSDPNAGCTTIRVCYKAAQPKWISPIHYTMNDGARMSSIETQSNIQTNKHHKLNLTNGNVHYIAPKLNIKFQWTAPATTCGVGLSKTTYQFKLTRLLDGQTLNGAAQNNPPVLIEENLRTTFYNLDTLRFPNLLERGATYVAQVTATSNDDVITIENRGKSEVSWFVYGDKTKTEDEKEIVKTEIKKEKATEEETKVAEKEEEKKEEEEEDSVDKQVSSSEVDCEIELPANQEAITTLKKGDEIKIGKFTLKITKLDSPKEKAYSGEGSIKANLWETNDYYTMNAFNVLVKFKDLKVNKNKEAFAGAAKGMYDANSGLSIEGDFSNKYVATGYNFLKKKFGGKVEDVAEELDVDGIGNFTGAAKALSAFALETPQTLPFNLELGNEITEDHGVDVGVSDLFFTPTGAMFSIYAVVNIPEANTKLAFGASDLCIYANPFKNGKLMLINNMNIPLGTNDYKLIVEGDKDEGGTYVKWTTKGYEGMQLSGRLELPKDQIKNVKDPEKPASFNFAVSCMDWGDWTAKLSMNDGEKFEFIDLEGYEFKIEEAIYDHSVKENPEGLAKVVSELKDNYKGDVSKFKGVFFKRLEAKMPAWITNKEKEDANRITFAVTNAFYDEQGFTMNIATENILSVKTGNLGGWGFSIDKMGIQIVQSTLTFGEMTGKFDMPILGKTKDNKGNNESGYINYNCLIKSENSDKEMSYSFTVTPPKEGLSYEFFDHFEAKIKNGSKISVEIKEDKGAQIAAEFNGELNVTVGKKLKFTAIDFEGLRIANFDKKNKPGFDFEFGTWTIGNGNFDLTDKKNNSDTSELLDQGYMEGGGARFVDSKMFEWIDDCAEAVNGKAKGNAKIDKGFSIGPFSATLDEVNFKLEDGEASNYKDVEHVKIITLDISTTLALAGFGEEGSGGSDMASITTSLGFDVPVGYNMPTANADEFFNLEMPKVDYSEIKVRFNEITLEGKFGPVEIYGSAMLFDEDDVYGDGFRGAAKVVLPAGIKAFATVQFGEVGEDSDLIKYWYVDAGVTFGSAGLEVGGGTFAINGFGGGVWKNMERTGEVKKANFKKVDKEELESSSEEEAGKETAIHLTEEDKENAKKVGEAPSGLTYKPVAAKSSAFGFYARVDYCASIAAGGVTTFNGSATMGMSFKGSKVDSVFLSGDIHVLSKESGSDGMVNADVAISYVHPKRFFNLKADVTGDLGIGNFKVPLIIRADGMNEKYYLALGEPEYSKDGSCDEDTKTICLSLLDMGDEGDTLYAQLTAQAYICGGNDIPYVGLPKVPEKITQLLEGDVNQYRKNPKAVTSSGLMMGARINGKFGFEFGPLYAHLESLAGFDVALTKLEEGIMCAEGGEMEGFNGYYAMGQVYAYLKGDTGVKLKIFGFKKKFSLVDIEAGALLQGGFIKPSWVRGRAKIEGSVLGGAVKFNTQARFSLGNQCTVEKDPLKDLVVIEAITPGSKSKNQAESDEEASVFTSPNIVANVKMNYTMGLPSSDSMDDLHTRNYRFTIDEVKVTNMSNQKVMTATKESYNGIKNNIITGTAWFKNRIRFTEKLEANTTYKVMVRVKIQEQRKRISGDPSGPSYGWYLPRNTQNKPYTKKEASREKVIYFKTGKLPDYIDENNITQGYPFENQRETFLRDASGQPIMGYFDLAMDQGYLFKGKNTEDMFGVFEEIRNASIQNLSDYVSPKIKFYYTYSPVSIGGFDFYRIKYPLKRLEKGKIYKVSFYVRTSKEKDAEFKLKEETKIIKGGEEKEDNRNFGLQDNKGFEFEEVNTSGNVLKINAAVANNLLIKGSGNSNPSLKRRATAVTAITKMTNTQTGETSDISENATTLDKASIDKYKQIMTEKGQKETHKNIFTNYFHISNYNTIKEKMSHIKLTPTFNYKNHRYYSDFTIKSAGSHSDASSRSYGDIPVRYLKVEFPFGTTVAEVHGIKSWDGQNAMDSNPNFYFQPILQRGNDNSYVKSFWEKMITTIKKVKKHSSEFKIPHVFDIRYLEEGKYDMMTGVSRMMDDATLTNFESSRLSQSEISGYPQIPSSHNNMPTMYYRYRHISATTHQLMMAGILARKYDWKGNFSIKFFAGTTSLTSSDLGAVSLNNSIASDFKTIRNTIIPFSHSTSFYDYWKKLAKEHKQWTKDLYKKDFKIHNHKVEIFYRKSNFSSDNSNKVIITKPVSVPSKF